MELETLIGIGLIALVGVYLCVVVFFLNKKKSEADIEAAFDEVLQNKSKTKLFYYEQILAEKLSINENQVRPFIYAERSLILVLAFISWVMMGFVGIGIFASAIILILLNNKLRQYIYESGVERLNDTIAFMDFFAPSIASGNSASQAFLEYVNRLPNDDTSKELLVQYYNAKTSGDLTYETPESILPIVSAYENAVYNEEKGVDDYLYIIEEYKKDLFTKHRYYTQFQTSVNGVIKPITWAYMIFVPACIFMTMGSAGGFWQSFLGFIAVCLLVFFFFMFRFLLNRLEITTIKKIL